MGRGPPPKRVFTARSRFYPACRLARILGIIIGGAVVSIAGLSWLLVALTEPSAQGPDRGRGLWHGLGTGGAAPTGVGLRVRMEIETSAVFAETSQRFLCWTIDMTDDREFFDLDFSSPDLSFLARELVVASSPYSSFVRIGGTGADFLTYAVGASRDCQETEFGAPLPSRIDPEAQMKKYYIGGERCFRPERIDALLEFLKRLRAPVILGLNIQKRKGTRWDPTNARELIDYAKSRNYHFSGFQLGNEVNLEIPPAAMVEDFHVLQQMLHDVFPNPRTGRPFLLGPDPHSLHKGKGSRYERNILSYLGQFAAEIETRKGLTLGGISHHEYIQVIIPNAMRRDDVGGFESGTVKKDEANVLDPAWLDRSKTVATAVSDAVLTKAPCQQIWLSELGPHNAGRPRCVQGGRWANFGNSLWYMDALASKAAAGYGVVCRQSLIGADYSLLDCATQEPLPDYYATLLWARLMGQRVLTSRLALAEEGPRPGGDAGPPADETVRRRMTFLRGAVNAETGERGALVRAYAHCAKAGTGITLLIINLSHENVEVEDVALLQDPVLAAAAREVSAAFLGIRQDGRIAEGYERVFVAGNGSAAPAHLTALLEHQAALQDDFLQRASERRESRPYIMTEEDFAARRRADRQEVNGVAGNETSQEGPHRKLGAERGESRDVLGSVRVEYVMANPVGDLGGMDVMLNDVVLRPIREGDAEVGEVPRLSVWDRISILLRRAGLVSRLARPRGAPIRSLPAMDGRVVDAASEPIRLPPTSYGFFSYPEAKLDVCRALSPRSIRQQRSRCVAARSDALRRRDMEEEEEVATAAAAAAKQVEAMRRGSVEDGEGAADAAPKKPAGPLRFEVDTDEAEGADAAGPPAAT